MKKTALVIMAAGMGSRFGGPKQITPVGPSDEKIIDYSVFDAKRAGFNEVIFIVNKKIENDFKECIGNKISQYIPVKYVIQDLNNIPLGCSVPEGRVKPWGTGHAILSCKDVIDCPFMVLNADDFYGNQCFQILHDFLVNIDDNDDNIQLAMAGYKLGNTITENGSVSRGICTTDSDNNLATIIERTDIRNIDGDIKFTEDGGETFHPLSYDDITSLNCWAFDNRALPEFEKQFIEFFQAGFANPLKSEFFLPSVVNNMIVSGKATAKVLETNDKWYGMTYSEDRIIVMNAIKDMVKKGIYPEKLWD